MGVDAFKMFKLASSGYCCSQILIIMYLEKNGLENVPLVKSMAGLCAGVGNTGKTCGIITGGACLFGLYAGKGLDTEVRDDNLKKMIQEFVQWFEDEFEYTECIDLITVDVLNDINESEAYPVKCGNTMQKCYNKIDEILKNYGYLE
ncbi:MULTISPECIES: DVU_1555 family C-GCAxxG-C-C protein [Clostridium]|uniref:DVU_1555 family C-GCAxxG-C-C protein n=1 Tax=Clostridium TaxID=1485 RepID=UPI000984052E|nr:MULTISPECIES: DV_1555 family C-GCAxxG-C-C protein [Clostridium]AQR93441.1 putative redox-active protein [Clostridium saccharoperbutylacetonicum]NSB29139.1 C_GCAxxG_C_C family probable redox protein [Clostridium saccharoperbutylacetonicum]